MHETTTDEPPAAPSAGSEAASLELDADTMRRFGYRVVDVVVDHLTGLAGAPIGRRGDPQELAERLGGPPPEQPAAFEEVLRTLREEVFAHTLQTQHPRFFAFVPSPNNYAAVLAEALTAGFNPFVGTWFAGSGAIQIELATVDWLRAWCGMPEAAGGLFVSGGSMANLTALAVARHTLLDDRIEGAVAYFSDQTHSAVERALRVLGFGDGALRQLPSDDAFRLSPRRLAAAVAEDRAAGRRPFCVIANAGTTNTGAVDPLPELAALCRREGLWLHADGAYGAASAICARGRAALGGLGAVDSLALDPHKWLFQPFETGCVLVRERDLLRRTFHVHPAYLRDIERTETEVNLSNYGVQLTRSFRALKLWMTFQLFGARAMRQAVERGFELCDRGEELLRASPRWEVVTPSQLAVLSFRYAPPGATEEEAEAVQRRLVERLLADGYALLTSTVLGGRTVLRLCTINPRTTEQDLERTLERVAELAGQLLAELRRGGGGEPAAPA